MRLGEQVASVHTSSGLARTHGGPIRFDRAILATGSRAVVDDLRGVSKRGVFTLRSLEDYLALSASLGGLRGSPSPAPYLSR